MTEQIIIIEDDVDNCKLMEKVISHYGYTYKFFSKGQEALFYLKSNSPPALILTDIALPDMHGVELIKQIKKSPEYANVKIVAITAHSNIEMQKQVLDAGAVNMLSKPYSPSELVKLIEQYVKKNNHQSF